jgi:hypothetical protein
MRDRLGRIALDVALVTLGLLLGRRFATKPRPTPNPTGPVTLGTSGDAPILERQRPDARQGSTAASSSIATDNGGNDVPRRVGRLTGGWQVVSFVVFALVTLGLCLWIKPPNDTLAKLSPVFSVVVPTPFYDAASTAPIPPTFVGYTELHRSGDVTINVDVSYSATTQRDTPAALTVDLPVHGAKVLACGSTSDTCTIASPVPEDPQLHEELTIRTTLHPSDTEHRFVAVISDIDGVGYVTTHGHAEVHFPSWSIVAGRGALPGGSDCITEMDYMIDDADKYSWSGAVPGYTSPQDAHWRFPWTNSPPPAVSGTREDVAAADNRNSFYAGALIGVSGAALTAAVQAAFTEAAERRRRATTTPEARNP